MKELKEYIRSIPDFPEKGIIFRDVTSVLQDADALKLSIDELAKRLEGVDFDVIAGAESRGFIFGAPLAYVMHKPFVPIRKKGKLMNEYGIATRSGIHCAPLMHKFFGTQKQGMVRFSFSYYNTNDEINEAAEALMQIAALR